MGNNDAGATLRQELREKLSGTTGTTLTGLDCLELSSYIQGILSHAAAVEAERGAQAKVISNLQHDIAIERAKYRGAVERAEGAEAERDKLRHDFAVLTEAYDDLRKAFQELSTQ